MSAGIAELTPSRAMPATLSFSIKVDPATGQQYMAVSQKGRPLLLNSFTNKGTAFTRRERDELDLGGLVPPAVCTMRQQMDRTYENFKAKMGFPFALLSDADEALCTQFGVIKMKNMYGKQVRGIERSTFVIDGARMLAKEWRGVKVPGHAQEVLDFVKTIV